MSPGLVAGTGQPDTVAAAADRNTAHNTAIVPSRRPAALGSWPHIAPVKVPQPADQPTAYSKFIVRV